MVEIFAEIESLCYSATWRHGHVYLSETGLGQALIQ